MIRRVALRCNLVVAFAMLVAACVRAQGAKAAGPSSITISGAVTTPLTLSIADLEKMPQTTVSVVNPHNHKTEIYRGVLLDSLLQQAGVPRGEAIRGKWMTAYVLATAADGYRVVYSLAEMDSGFLDSSVLVADQMNDAPLTPDEGPLKLVAPHEKRPARWVRMLKSITVELAN